MLIRLIASKMNELMARREFLEMPREIQVELQEEYHKYLGRVQPLLRWYKIKVNGKDEYVTEEMWIAVMCAEAEEVTYEEMIKEREASGSS